MTVTDKNHRLQRDDKSNFSGLTIRLSLLRNRLAGYRHREEQIKLARGGGDF